MTETEQKILQLLEKETMSPNAMAGRMNISRQALHRYLKALIKEERIQKTGLGPHVVYSLSGRLSESKVIEGFDFLSKIILPVYKKKFTSCIKKAAQKNISGDLKFGFMLEAAAVYSSNIEGNSMNLDSFLNSRMASVKFRPKEAEEIEDLVGAYAFIKNHILNEKNMLKAHGMLSRHFVIKSRQGKYRKEPVGVFSKRGMEYLAIEPHLIEGEMKKFFRKTDVLRKADLSVTEIIFWASWIHLMMALIHPFADGNGRIARLCEKWFLIEKLGEKMLRLSSEEYYFKDRPQYYSTLRLGVNYWETDFKKSMPFLELLKQAFTAKP